MIDDDYIKKFDERVSSIIESYPLKKSFAVIGFVSSLVAAFLNYLHYRILGLGLSETGSNYLEFLLYVLKSFFIITIIVFVFHRLKKRAAITIPENFYKFEELILKIKDKNTKRNELIELQSAIDKKIYQVREHCEKFKSNIERNKNKVKDLKKALRDNERRNLNEIEESERINNEIVGLDSEAASLSDKVARIDKSLNRSNFLNKKNGGKEPSLPVDISSLLGEINSLNNDFKECECDIKIELTFLSRLKGLFKAAVKLSPRGVVFFDIYVESKLKEVYGILKKIKIIVKRFLNIFMGLRLNTIVILKKKLNL